MPTPESARLAQRILAVLETVYGGNPEFQEAARDRGISLHQLAAAAIAEMIADDVTGMMRMAHADMERELEQQYQRIRGMLANHGEKVLRLF